MLPLPGSIIILIIMKVAIWDTYVQRKGGKIMHFDIVVPETVKEQEIIFKFGAHYLAGKGEAGHILKSDECRFCHVSAAPPNIVADIEAKGYSIIEMENCN